MAIFKSKFPDLVIPDNVSISQYTLDEAPKFGDKVAFEDGFSGRKLTFVQVYGAARKAASSLAAKGYKKGDVLAINLPNLPEYAVVFHSAAMLGGIVTTVNPLYTADEIAFQLRDTGAIYIVTVQPLLDKVKDAVAKEGVMVKEIFILGEPVEGTTPFATLLAGDGRVPEVQINPKEDIVVIPYSSGTTGLPKGVMLTHYNLIANIAQVQALEGVCYRADEKLVGVLPFFHIYGMTLMMQFVLRYGYTTVTIPRFDLQQFLQVIQNQKITIAHIVPPIIIALAKHPVVDNFDLKSLRLVFSGAAPLGAEVEALLEQRLNWVKVKQAYGMTEMSPGAMINPSGAIVHGSIGILLPNMEAKIVDTATGEHLDVNKDGEICLRGPNIMKGYWGNPDATANTIDSENFIHTGDVGHVDDDGYYWIVDRVKELIKYKGFQVAPAELEALLLSNAHVADAAVIGRPDEEAGELPKAFVVLKAPQGADPAPTADHLVEWLAEKLAPHKKLRGGVEFVDQIPKSPSGKILRRMLKAREIEKINTPK